jgi:F0F1-type ATP synthase assembly protein I
MRLHRKMVILFGRRLSMVDFSKKGNKKKRIAAMVICVLLVAGMVVGMLVAAL